VDWQARVRSRLAVLGLEAHREQQAVEEIAQHLEELCEESMRDGLEPAAAEAAALAELERHGEELAARFGELGRRAAPGIAGSQAGMPAPVVAGAPAGGGLLADLRQDLRFGARALLRRPLFAVVAVATLALGVGANTAIFSLVDSVLLRPLPYREPGRLVHFFEIKQNQDFGRREASYPDFLDLREGGTLFETLAGYNGGSASLSVDGGAPERVQLLEVSHDFFAMLGVEAALGRTFLPGESGVGAAQVAVLTDGAWRTRFGADPAILGRAISLSGHPYTVVGVLPRDFQFPLRGLAEVWLPLDVRPRVAGLRGRHWLDVIGRIRPGVTIEQARRQLEQVMTGVAERDPEWHEKIGVALVPLRDEMTGGVRPAMIATMAAVGFLLLVACSNLANLLLARASERQREFAVRSSLGARPGRLVRQLLAESLLLSLLGGALGLFLALWGAHLAVAALPARTVATLPFLAGFSLHLPAFLFTLSIVVATTLFFGLAPALHAARVQPADALHRGRAAAPATRSRLGRALVVSEIAATLVLLLAAGLVSKSLLHLLETSPGFRTGNLLSMRLSPPIGASLEDANLLRLHADLLERVGSLPGVSGVATVSQLPLTGRGDTGRAEIESRPGEKGVEANMRGISPGYFRMLGIPLVGGRGFGDDDRPDSAWTLMVNRTFERRAFDGASAVGQRLRFSFLPGQPWLEIVGVVGDEKVDTLDSEVTPIVYFSQAQIPDATYSLLVRSLDDPERLVRSVTAEIHAIDPLWPVYAVRTMDEVIADSTPVFLRRYLAWLLGAFALIAAVVAAVGVYGVIALSVAQRRQEIGVRISLGAARGEIVRLILGQGLRLAAIGVAAGLVAAALVSRLARSLLFGVSAADPAVLGAAVAVVTAAAVAACAVPALRAARVDPVVALRAE